MSKHNNSAWNPGIEPETPREYQQLETIYRPENVDSSIADTEELSRWTGLNHEELVIFKPGRLAVHELIVRVTADIVVLEGEDELDLGRNFRRIAGTILTDFVEPHNVEIQKAWYDLHDRVLQMVHSVLGETLFKAPDTTTQKKGLLHFLFQGKYGSESRSNESIHDREHKVLLEFREKGLAEDNPLTRAVYRSLYRILDSIAANRGFLGPDKSLLARLVCDHVCNNHGSRVIGELITPWIDQAIERNGYLRVPNAKYPLLISLKGASAAGKSSLRPMLRQIFKQQGISAEGYATISPDIWRRFLLDFESLGNAFKYAGRLTSKEVILIDSKLDHYIRYKANRNGSIPHLLVDRFRFDSFASEKISKILYGTYVKYVDTMYMYFVVTPPEETVERGWERGLKTGRYKAVEDFLDHSVEAHTGMPKIFFKWLAFEKPLFRYEFLDNSVPKGAYPATIAFGAQQEINIVDISAFINIERYQKINIKAKTPQQVYPDNSKLSVLNNIGFLKRCTQKIPTVNFVDQATATVYSCTRSGIPEIIDASIFNEKLIDEETAQVFSAMGFK